MSNCDQELCPYWDGHGCPCAVLDIDEEARNAERVRCGFPPLSREKVPDARPGT